MEIIRNQEVALKEITRVLDACDNIKYSLVKKVKIRNKFTRGDQVLRNVIIISLGDNSEKPYIVCAMRSLGDTKTYILNEDVTHWNVNDNELTTSFGGHTFFIRTFCNQVLQCHIWNDPESASKFLMGNLMEGNPNDAFRRPNSLAVNIKEKPYYLIGGMAKKNTTFEQIVLGRYDTTDKSRSDKIRLKEIIDDLKKDGNVYAYVRGNDDLFKDFYWDIVNKKEIEDGKYLVSSYYKQYTIDDTEETGEIPREEVDVCCVGCGSAGGNIIDTISRMEYFNSYVLIDFDVVEKKNLRNQPYTRNDITYTKVSSLSNKITRVKAGTKVQTYTKDYKNIYFSQYKFKYVISGFDTIECRLGLLDKIKSGEIETKYLIDTRYLDLDSSLFFIDVSNADEMEYYEKILKEDLEAFNKEQKRNPKEKLSKKEIIDYCNKNDVFNSSCARFANDLGLEGSPEASICYRVDAEAYQCGSDECKRCIYKAVNGFLPEETSCLAVNIIQIYKYTSAFVASIIRDIETDNIKPVTHVDLTADPIPRSITIKK